MDQTILIIEDEVPLREALNMKLTKEGYKVLQAPDGEAGLNMAKTQKVDLILLDILMPKLNGLDVLKGIKSNPALQKIPVIVLTNLPEESTKTKVNELGAQEYLVKSNVPIEEIVGKIKEHLNQ
jgi:DNA-binding response OmpR family regulator